MAVTAENPDAAVTVDNLYLKRVQALNRIRKLVGSRTELRLPRIVVAGDQSSGKSSVLERLTGIRFPVKAGICTKAAIVAECHRDPKLSADQFELFENDRFARVELGALPYKILDLQQELLTASGKKVCTEEIVVRVSGPAQMDIIVIDLPGIIHTGEGKAETRALINKYVQHEETLIMLVSEATRNDEIFEAIDLAKKVDPAGKRTLRVLTKFDNFDSVDSKLAAIGLVMDSRRDAERTDDATNLGPHAVICKPNGEDEQYCGDKENAQLAALGLAPERAGVASLKERLPPIFAALIQTNLPTMRKSIDHAVAANERALARIGAEPVCGAFMVTACQRALLDAENAVREGITESMYEFKEAVHAFESELESKCNEAEEYNEAEEEMRESQASEEGEEKENEAAKIEIRSKLKPDAFTCVLFQGAEAFRECTRDIQEAWKPLLEDYIKGAEAKMHATLQRALKDACGAPESVRDIILKRLESFFEDELFRAFRTCCWEAFEKEIDWGTVNHYFTSKYDAERKLPDELVEEFVNAIQLNHCSDPYNSGLSCLQTTKDSMRKLLKERKEMFEARFRGLNMHEQQQERLLHAVHAWYAVEKKTFTDVILKATKAHLLEGQRRWVQSALLVDAKLMEAAVEDDSIRGERKRLKDLLVRLRECLNEVRGML